MIFSPALKPAKKQRYKIRITQGMTSKRRQCGMLHFAFTLNIFSHIISCNSCLKSKLICSPTQNSAVSLEFFFLKQEKRTAGRLSPNILPCPVGELVMKRLLKFLWFLLHRWALLFSSFLLLLHTGSYFQKLLLSSLLLN